MPSSPPLSRAATGLLLALAACSDGGPAPAATGASPGGGEGGRTNLILISLDTCRADRLSCYGAERQNTPALDRLAAESVRFSDCLAQSCVTAPSHMSLLTSHYVHRHGLKKNGLESHPPYTLASTLRDAGWRTAAFTGHGSFQAKYGHGVGFETFESWEGPEAWPFTRHLDQTLPQGLDWLDQHADEPFFLLLHGYDPHCPYWPEEGVREQYGGWYRGGLSLEKLCGPPAFAELIRRGRIGPDELRYINDMYEGELLLADRALGAFFDELERRGLLERSIVVFTSDHGEDLGERNRVGHGALTPKILSVPLLIRFPGARHAGVVGEPVEGVDLMPTLLSALGVPAPEGLQGRDLMPLVTGGRPPWVGERLRIAQANENVSLRFGQRWKLDFSLDRSRPSSQALYDLERDPTQERNLYATPEGRQRFDELSSRFLEWRASSARQDQELYSPTGEANAADREMLEALGYTDGG